MRTRRIFLRSEALGRGYAPALCNGTRAIRNTACYLIRNVQSALAKGEGFQTSRERCALLKAGIAIRQENAEKERRFALKVRKCSDALRDEKVRALEAHSMVRDALMKTRPLPLPDREHSILSYAQLDAVMKVTGDQSYYALPAQMNQQAIRRPCKSWKGYFAALKAYAEDPSGFLGKPKRPGYLEGEATAFLTFQICRYSEAGGRGYLTLPSSKPCGIFGKKICIGPPLPGAYVKAELKPAFGGYFLLVTYEREGGEAGRKPDPKRVIAGDPGVNNFLALAYNFAHDPVLISGKYLKSLNRQYNRRLGLLSSVRGSRKGQSAEADRLVSAASRLRDAKIRDLFYKTAHYIGRLCASLDAGTFILGHNRYWKQGCPFRRDDAQNFVQIPYSLFAQVLSTVLPRYGVVFALQEESYTSRADFLSGDDIPVYGQEKGTPVFSGKRVHRGLYRSKDGTVLNADVNGAANILRKAVPDAFSGTGDMSYLSRNVRVLRMESLIGYTGVKASKKEARFARLHAEQGSTRKVKRIPREGVSGRVTGRDEAARPNSEAPAVA